MKAYAICLSALLLAFNLRACVNYTGSGTKFNGASISGGPRERYMELLQDRVKSEFGGGRRKNGS